PLFREQVDRGLATMRSQAGVDLSQTLFPDDVRLEEATIQLERPSIQLSVLFIIEYALANLWLNWGLKPSGMIGHSMGENTAACLAGVLSYEDCLSLVTLRGQLAETTPAGGMLSVQLTEQELVPLLGQELDLASVNLPNSCVVSGPSLAVDALAGELAR